tara:strand:+ start:531 stop:680 length:150 start_codon:yes stop_codon:yes gene_type:complete
MMFWRKKKPTINKHFKKKLIEELARLRNDSLLVAKDVEKLIKKIKVEKL